MALAAMAALSGGLAVGAVDGRSGDHVLLAPPFIATRDELAQIVHRLDMALASALAGLPA